MADHHLQAPLSTADVRQLKLGDHVFLSGPAFTCRSRLHRHVLDEGHPLPTDAASRNVLIHVGPVVVHREGRWDLVSFMPTSSIRFEKWGARAVREWNLKLILGKTTMGPETAAAMKDCGCVHVTPQSVSPNLWVDSIRIEKVDLFDALGSIEATWYMELSELGPFLVDMDCEGNNYFDAISAKVETRRKAAYQRLGIPEDFTYTKLYG